jgi:uncharacterized protein
VYYAVTPPLIVNTVNWRLEMVMISRLWKMLCVALISLGLFVVPAVAGSKEDFNLAEIYYNKGNYKEALKLFRKSAWRGDTLSQINLGLMYEGGKGIDQNYIQAAMWYRKAAEKGEPTAQYNLGLMYVKGLGVNQDYVQAYKWWDISVVLGDEAAEKLRDAVAEKMTTQQIIAAQKLAREWMTAHQP